MKTTLLLVAAFALVKCQHPFLNHYYYLRFPNALGNLRYPYHFSDYESQGNIWTVQHERSDEDLTGAVSINSQAETEGRTMIRPSNDISPRFFFYNNFDTNFAIQRPQFALNRRTVIYTTTSTRTIVTTSNCFASNLFVANAAQCANRKRDVQAQLEALIVDDGDDEGPSHVQTVETTAIPPPVSFSERLDYHSDIISSINGAKESKVDRPKRFFGLTVSTFTQYSFTTSTIARRINAQLLLANAACPLGTGANSCLLSCIPIGYTAC